MYVHGGRTQDRVLDDLYALDLSQFPLRWRRIGTPHCAQDTFACLAVSNTFTHCLQRARRRPQPLTTSA